MKQIGDRICYGCICNNDDFMNYLYQLVNKKDVYGCTIQPIPPTQNSIAGGFFLLPLQKIEGWCKLYNHTLLRYLRNNRLVKDDQTILVDCILSKENQGLFQLFRENLSDKDNWFMFQRILQ
jgi:hypothetical protein